MRPRWAAPHRVSAVCSPGRWLHAGVDTKKEETTGVRKVAGASDGTTATAAGLRPWVWLRLHPVEKWTTLVDLGRRAPALLERSSFAAQGDGDEEEKTANIVTRLLRQRERGINVAALQGRLSPLAQRRHYLLVHKLPYCVRLRLCLSFLMWVRSLRDVQDTLARLRLPYATTRRVQRSVVADVFPTRMMERFVDPFTTVAVKMDANINAAAEQVPAPHAWHPEQDERAEEEEEEKRKKRRTRRGATHGGRLSGRCSRGSRGEGAGSRRLGGNRKLLLAVQGMQGRASDDDRLFGRTARSSCRSLQQSPFASWARRKALSPVSSSSSSVNDACRSALPSPLAVDHEEDERYHHNFIRGEGCPIDENGRLASVPIHILVPLATNLLTLERCCAMAHAAVLSSLFVEGRTVCLTTNNSLLREYVMFLFEELIEDGWVSVSLCEEPRRPYIPGWVTKETVLVVLPPRDEKSLSHRELRHMASMILQYAPCSVLVEAAPCDQVSHYTRALRETVSKEQASVVTPETEAQWRVSWVPVSPSTTFGGIKENVKDATVEFQAAVNEILRQFYAVTFIYTPYNCSLSPRQVQDWWWHKLPSSIHIVAVNSHALDLLYYFPQAPFLRKKVGNAFRYRAVQRVLLGKNLYGGREDPVRQWVHRWLGWRGLARTGLYAPMAVKDKARVLLADQASPRADGNDADDEAVDALVWERTVDYLANPSRLHWIALMAAKLFRV
ncbi:uncharacterized protein Tco025E_03558 [Trypanosoma conorhini]|uniref:Uncharacterized protein n=1 Tax=Trypanosoma conorhini TaxID=83891 RepID=A0A3R7NP62_9TRYP|nr:uncharacterized protein Tco025E_03558 [Trypanosoma conorhini]RNF21242.1 hypothetical protein Tco025E_03558 [Trypanosoma conorhini]